MAGRFDHAGGVWDKVSKRNDKVGGIYQPVKKRFVKAGGILRPSFSAEPAYTFKDYPYSWTTGGHTYTYNNRTYAGAGNEILSSLCGAAEYTADWIYNQVTLTFNEPVKFTSGIVTAYVESDDSTYKSEIMVLYGGDDTGTSYSYIHWINDSYILGTTPHTVVSSIATPITYHIMLRFYRKQSADQTTIFHATLQLTTDDGRTFYVHL